MAWRLALDRAAGRLRRLRPEPDGPAARLRRVLRALRGQGPRPRDDRRPPPGHRDRLPPGARRRRRACGSRSGRPVEPLRRRIRALEVGRRPTTTAPARAPRRLPRAVPHPAREGRGDRRRRDGGARRPAPSRSRPRRSKGLSRRWCTTARRRTRAGRRSSASRSPCGAARRELADMARRTIERVWEVARVPTEVVVVDNGSPVRGAPRRPRPPLPGEPRRVGRLEHRDPPARRPPWWRCSTATAGSSRAGTRRCSRRPPTGAASRSRTPTTATAAGFTRPDQAGTAGWCFMLTRDLYDEVGPFDEWFSPAFCEDTDYWHRAWQLGIELSPVPAARVVHARRTSSQTTAHDLLLQAHRYKYGWKHGVDPDRAPPYYNREIVDYAARGRSAMRVRSGPDRPTGRSGIGLNKTGTSSFHEAMEILGLDSLHWGGPDVRQRGARPRWPRADPLLSGLDPRYRRLLRHRALSTHFDAARRAVPGQPVRPDRPADRRVDRQPPPPRRAQHRPPRARATTTGPSWWSTRTPGASSGTATSGASGATSRADGTSSRSTSPLARVGPAVRAPGASANRPNRSRGRTAIGPRTPTSADLRHCGLEEPSAA